MLGLDKNHCLLNFCIHESISVCLYLYVLRNVELIYIWISRSHFIFPCKYKWAIHIRAHQTRWSGRSSRPISAEIALSRLQNGQNEIAVALFPFASRSFLANNLRFKVKVIDKAIVINIKIHKNERKRLYSSNKENLTC